MQVANVASVSIKRTELMRMNYESDIEISWSESDTGEFCAKSPAALRATGLKSQM